MSACLQRAGIGYVLIERSSQLAGSWRHHYDRLHLHTSRAFSGLPHWPMPRSYPRYPARDQVVAYLDAYARHFGIAPWCEVDATRVTREGANWIVSTSRGDIRCGAVVLATGTNGEPVIPSWPGLETFEGPVLHSQDYRNGRGFRGRRVLVVGFGNSGGEIALDLVEHGAEPVVSVRGRVNVVPRDILGIPVLAIAIPLAKLPPRLADGLVWPLLKAYYPSYRALGLRKAARGPFQQISRARRIPLLDIGTIRQIRRGAIQVRRGISHLVGSTVVFQDGVEQVVDAIVLATGYRAALPPGITLPEKVAAGGGPSPTSGPYFCGFFVSPTGMLREIGIEARAIAARIGADRDNGSGAS